MRRSLRPVARSDVMARGGRIGLCFTVLLVRDPLDVGVHRHVGTLAVEAAEELPVAVATEDHLVKNARAADDLRGTTEPCAGPSPDTPRATFGLPLIRAGAAATVSPSVQMDQTMGMV